MLQFMNHRGCAVRIPRAIPESLRGRERAELLASRRPGGIRLDLRRYHPDPNQSRRR